MHGELTVKEHVDFSEFSRYLLDLFENKLLDYIVYVNTGWQALGANAKLNHYPKDSSGIVVIPEFSFNERTTAKDFPMVRNHDTDIIVLSGISDAPIYDRVLEHTKRLFDYYSINNKLGARHEVDVITKYPYVSLFNSVFSNTDTMRDISPHYILVDPGYEAYTPDPVIARPFLRNSFGKLDLIVRENLLDNIKIDRRNLFNLKDQNLIHNQSILDDYQSIIPEISTVSQDLVLLLTQPPNALDIQKEDWVEGLDAICSDMIDQGYDLVLKPHPSENIRKYHRLSVHDEIDYITDNVDAEELVADLAPEIVLGYTTTALLSLSVLYDIKSYTFANSSRYHISESRGLHEELFVTRTTNYVGSIDGLFK